MSGISATEGKLSCRRYIESLSMELSVAVIIPVSDTQMLHVLDLKYLSSVLSLSTSVQVLSRRFKVICSSYGGRPLSISIAGRSEAANIYTKLMYGGQRCASSPSDRSSCIPCLERKYLDPCTDQQKRRHFDSVSRLLSSIFEGLSSIVV